ncbi:unnamed protein product [Ostreobium quekettii]|uniref:AAA+ ATPase domain-containing protein n=1 Tax=Ostreobium quekettii TaxID=121088 RepID=A0A8S1IQN5_9CHLO|nr:unnamed protein product [Ostreobium quekettii]|eukprot:evm.model.scf_139.2 EVM.evm.TU.scf_139.2   scf_139:26162-31086(+)
MALGQDALSGRDEQVAALRAFLSERFDSGTGGAAYLSGLPGTGKTLTVHTALSNLSNYPCAHKQPPAVVSINCMTLPDAKSVYRAMLQGLHDHCRGSATEGTGASGSCRIVYPQLEVDRPLSPSTCLGDNVDSQAAFEKLISEAPRGRKRKRGGGSRSLENRGMLVVLLDEMDGLLTTDKTVLYNLFHLASTSPRLVLIGAANSIDLTERVIPELDARGCKPTLVLFPSYRSSDILGVLRQRLASCPCHPFQSTALEVCARKVAARSGDMRQALHACRASLNSAVEDGGTCQPIGVKEILRALQPMEDLRGSTATLECVRKLPCSQQVLLYAVWELCDSAFPSTPLSLRTPGSIQSPCSTPCSRMKGTLHTPRALRTTRTPRTPCTPHTPHTPVTPSNKSDTALATVYERFSSLCSSLQLECGSMQEAKQMLGCLSDAALLDMDCKGKRGRNAKVRLRVTRREIEGAFKDHALLKYIVSSS